MKLMSYHSSRIKTFTVTIVMLMGLMLQSCTKDKISATPINIGTVRFAANAYTIENNTANPLVVVLPLSLPLEQDATVLVSIDNSSTIASSEYAISPAIPGSGFLVTLPKGSTEVSFKVNSLNNFEGEKTLVLGLSSPTGGLTVSNTNATAVINIKGNPIIYPEIQTSTTILDFGNAISGTNSASKSYTLKGVKLTANVSITASANFEVSLNNITFTNSLAIPFATVNAAPITLYARFTALTGINQSVSGTITHSSGTVADNAITASGIEYGVALPGVLVMKEDFNYGTATSTLDAVAPGIWSVFAGTVNPAVYLSTGLTFIGYAGSGVGGAIVSENGAGSRKDYFRNFTSISSGVVYAAQLINVSAANTTIDFFMGMRDPAGGYINRINIKDDGSGKPTFAIGKNSSTVATATGTFSYGTTYLLVTKYDFNTGISSLFVLNAAPTRYEPPVPNATTNVGTNVASVLNVFVRQNTGVLTATIDGIRIATSWKDAVGL